MPRRCRLLFLSCLALRATGAASWPVPPEADRVDLRFRCGRDRAGVLVTLTWADGQTTALPLRADTDPAADDGCLVLPWGVKLYTRPNLTFYGNAARKAAVLKGWASFPAASEQWLHLVFRPGASGTQVWADGRFIHELAGRQQLRRVDVKPSPSATMGTVECSREPDSPYLPLELEAVARPANWTAAIGALAWPDKLADATLSLPAGATTLAGVPLRVATRGLDLAGAGWLDCPVDDLVSFYWRRNALAGLPEQTLLSVPQDTYVAAHVLCAAETDPAKVPEFTVRLTRYANSRGDALADTPVRLPHAAGQQVGTVRYAGAAVPLWLVRVPLKCGLLQDLLREDERKYGFSYPLPTAKYLDLELLDPLLGVDQADAFPPPLLPVGRTYKPDTRRSAVHVYAVTLERSPAELTVRPSTGRSIFYAAEQPALAATIGARAPGRYRLRWQFADFDGRVAAEGERAVEATGDTLARVPVDVGQGWYASRVLLCDEAGRELVDQRGTFVVLPPDTRRARFESPHGTWWFHWFHGGAPDLERCGPVFQRAGLRHTILPNSLPEEKTAPYALTWWCVPWKSPKMAPVDQFVAEFEQHIRDQRARWPHALPTVMLYHESSAYNAPFPPELWGAQPPAAAPADEANWTRRMEYVHAMSAMLRAKFPELSIQIGNAGDGCAMVGALLRRGLKPSEYDSVAVEDLGQTFIPERPVPGGMQSVWLLRETARRLGHPQARPTGCYEWIGRRNSALGLAGQAEWYIRDALQARAYGFQSIALGTLHDAGAGYFHTIWGSGGLCSRYPYMYPKPAYAALATLTQVLDRAQYVRAVPTGCLSVYALEFRRDDGWVYALWTPRGQRTVRLGLASGQPARVVDLVGRERALAGPVAALTVGTAAQYVVTPAPLATATADPAPAATPAEPPVATDSLATAQLNQDHLKWLDRTTGGNLPHRLRGNCTLRTVTDAERGACQELELQPTGEAWPLLHEHGIVKLAQPLVAPGECGSVGVWVKGNSGWGDVMFEVKDANGAPKLLLPDWPATTAINFDGWRLVRQKLPEGPTWRAKASLTALVVSLPRQMLYVTEMVKVTELRVRLKDAGLW